jgi:TPP-dependent pyruvate/acetoin dehydrogenase alpha subunit
MALTNENRIELFRTLVKAMALDRLMMRLIRAGSLVGFYHEGGIALAPGVAAGFFLTKSDIMLPHYRAHGLAHMLSKRVDVTLYFAEHLGRVGGCCKGRSSYHASFPADHIFGSSGNIGSNFPVSVGYGLAAKRKGQGQMVMNCSGDGSYGSGRSHEALLMSANWQLPVVFWCEANGMAQHSSMEKLFPGPNISSLASGFGIPSHVVDGQDLFACAEIAQIAIAHARAGKGPIFIECKTLRAQEHSVGGVNKAGINPRDPDLMQTWRAERNPERLTGARLIELGLLTEKDVTEIHAAADREADALAESCESLPKAMPSIEELQSAIYAQARS